MQENVLELIIITLLCYETNPLHSLLCFDNLQINKVHRTNSLSKYDI